MPDARRRKEQMNMPDERRRKEHTNTPAYNAGEMDEEKTRQRRWRAQDIEGGHAQWTEHAG